MKEDTSNPFLSLQSFPIRLVENASVSLAKGEGSSKAAGFHEEINAHLLENR